TIAYLSNEFPVSVEHYVGQEIQELRKRRINVITGSIRRSSGTAGTAPVSAGEALYLEPLRMGQLFRAVWLCLRNVKLLGDLLLRVLIQGRESPLRRFRAVLHTWLGAYYALSLQGRGVAHIHVHHGYFASWVAMVATRLLGIDFSMTLHGSDLLLHAAYLDTKLKNCNFCITISEFNRRYILAHYPDADPAKVAVCRMGVEASRAIPTPRVAPERVVMLAVGRLHAVKDHAFLIRVQDCERARAGISMHHRGRRAAACGVAAPDMWSGTSVAGAAPWTLLPRRARRSLLDERPRRAHQPQ